MASIDIEGLLAPISDEQPSGPDPEGLQEFTTLEIASTRKPETEIGGVVTPAVEPDWKAVQRFAEGLLQQAKDVRVAIRLVEAATHNDNLPGFHSGLELTYRLLDGFWDTMYPELDPDDDDPASFRIMRLKDLGNFGRMVRALRHAALAETRLHGAFSLADIKSIETGMADGQEGASARNAAMIDTFERAETEMLQSNLADARRSLELLQQISDLVDERSDGREDLGFDNLTDTLNEITIQLEEKLAQRGVSADQGEGAPPHDIDEDDDRVETANMSPATAALGRASSTPGIAAISSIGTREDAVRCIDLASRYFEQSEPSSPVPLILNRAKNLVDKDFIAILKDMAPEGLDNARNVVGRPPDDEE